MGRKCKGIFDAVFISFSYSLSMGSQKSTGSELRGYLETGSSFGIFKSFCCLWLTACPTSVDTGEGPKQGRVPSFSFSHSSEEPVPICSCSLCSHTHLWEMPREGISLLNLCQVMASYHFLPTLFGSYLFHRSGSSLLLIMVLKVTISMCTSWPKEKEHGDMRKPLWGWRASTTSAHIPLVKNT